MDSLAELPSPQEESYTGFSAKLCVMLVYLLHKPPCLLAGTAAHTSEVGWGFPLFWECVCMCMHVCKHMPVHAHTVCVLLQGCPVVCAVA